MKKILNGILIVGWGAVICMSLAGKIPITDYKIICPMLAGVLMIGNIFNILRKD